MDDALKQHLVLAREQYDKREYDLAERNLLEVRGPGDVIEIPLLLPDIHHKLSCETFTDCQIDNDN